jgi:hypothetical protein
MMAHISYSQVNEYTNCSERYRLTRIVGVNEDPAYWFIGGSAVHSATEAVDHHLYKEFKA